MIKKSSALGDYARRVAKELTHVDASGAARMVDVAAKDVTARRAVAAGFVRTTTEVVDLLRDGALPKGDALAGGPIPGVLGGKRTPRLFSPFYPIAPHRATVGLAFRDRNSAREG